ncbi:MAG: hypothetical protein ACFE9S_20400 [Candidatus Hermodarchaeota archaeon]
MSVFRYIVALILGVGTICLIAVFFVPPSIAPAFAVLGILLVVFGMISLALIYYNKRQHLTIKAWRSRKKQS